MELGETNPSLIGARERLELHEINYLKATNAFFPPLQLGKELQRVEGGDDQATLQIQWQYKGLLGQDSLTIKGGFIYDFEEMKDRYSIVYSLPLFPSADLVKERAQLDYQRAKEEYRHKEVEVLKDLLKIIGDLSLIMKEESLMEDRLDLLRMKLEKDRREYQGGLILPTRLESSKRALERQEDHLAALLMDRRRIGEEYYQMTGHQGLYPSFLKLPYQPLSLEGEKDDYLEFLLTQSPSLVEGDMRIQLASLTLKGAQRALGWQCTLHLLGNINPLPYERDWEVRLSFRKNLFYQEGKAGVLEQEILLREEKRVLQELERRLKEQFKNLFEYHLQLNKEILYVEEDLQQAISQYKRGGENLRDGYFSVIQYQEGLIGKKEVELLLEEILWQRLITLVEFMNLLGLSVEQILEVLLGETFL